MLESIRVFVDADACPVKAEVMRVAERHGVPATFVSNTFLRLPKHPLFQMQLVGKEFDAADDWITEKVDGKSVVVTNDILLAQHALEKRASVITPNGKVYSFSNIGNAVATRAIMQDLRASVGDKSGNANAHVGGPSAFSPKDRSTFLSSFHEAIERLKRERA